MDSKPSRDSAIYDALINMAILTQAPAVASGALLLTGSHSTGILLENSVAAQRQQNTSAQAETHAGIKMIRCIDTKACVVATELESQIEMPSDNTSSQPEELDPLGTSLLPNYRSTNK